MNFIRKFSLLALILIVANLEAESTDWPGWGGPNGDFKVSDAGIFLADQSFALKVVWKKPLGAGYSPVSIRDGLAVTMFSDETFDYVIALDAEDGSEKWRYKIGPAYLGHYGSQSGPLAAPVLTDDKVVALSAQGSLFALDKNTGQKLWDVDLVSEHQAVAPFWGFTSSPKLYHDLLIVQTGGSQAVSAFKLDSGDEVWSAVSDSVYYQSPGLFKLNNQDHLVFHGNTRLAGLSPRTGKVLWEFEHGGQVNASGTSGHPVEIGDGRYFVKNRGNGGVLIQVRGDHETYSVEKVWETRDIRSTYIYAVYHEGYLFGYNRRILNSVNVKDGKRAWRSREPGDGLPIVVDDHLVIITKDGKLAVAQASGDGYNEKARLEIFDAIVWSHASLANGKFYARSMSEIACVEVVPEDQVADSKAPVNGIVAHSQFAQFVQKVNQSTDKTSLIDQFMAEQKRFPILEGDDLVHFVYRGDANVVTITGDHTGRRIDYPMHQIEGTDLFYYSAQLEPDARITYHYTLNLQRSIEDPLNPQNIRSLYFGRASWFGMPRWELPSHLEKRADGVVGRIDSVRFESASVNGSKKLELYLPAGYDAGDERYPVVYVHAARRQWALGKVDVSLDNVIGNSVQPTIVVFVPSLVGGGYREYVGENRDAYKKVFVEEVVPFIDQKYRTIKSRDARANMGTVYGGFMSFYATFKHPEVFGKLAIQSVWWDQVSRAKDADLVFAPSEQLPVDIYLDWGKYDMRSPNEGNDLGICSEIFAQLLADKGYSFTGGEVNDGAGWASWRNRTDKLFEALFPLSQ